MQRRMPCASEAIILSIALAMCVVSTPRLVAQSVRPPFRAAINLISLSVTVSTPNRQYVGDLIQDDFVVRENGVPQDLTFFARTRVPLTLALLLDTSASMERTLSTAQEAATGFARTLGQPDRAMVVDFDSTVRTVQPLTNDLQALEKAIRATQAGGATALYNAVYIALTELGKFSRGDDQQVPRRRAIVVLSDGADTSSLVDFETVLDLASRSDIIIYTIGLGFKEETPIRTGSNDEQFVLRRLAERTGGRAFFPNEIKELADVYRDIRDELSSQYSLAYESSSRANDGAWRSISVQVKRPSMMVRTRQGYYAPAP